MLSTTQTSNLLKEPNGLQLLTKALNTAISSARRDMECDLAEVQDLDGRRWYDTDGGMFLGECASDREFRAMTLQSITFLEEFGLIERHPDRLNLVRYAQRY